SLSVVLALSLCFFFQAEDGIRDRTVTGVQTCALPIWRSLASLADEAASHRRGVGADGHALAQARPRAAPRRALLPHARGVPASEIGRASCRESVYIRVREGAVEDRSEYETRHAAPKAR